jgi:acetyltransferase-like isoleucine patch superfamily enzyme
LQKVACLSAPLLPRRLRHWAYRRLAGYEIASSAHIGRALVLTPQLRMGPGSSIGSGNVIRGCDIVSLEEEAGIGNLNLINGVRRSSPYFDASPRSPALIMRRGAKISALHFIDCTDTLEIEELATISGAMSQILTHSFKVSTGRQHAEPVRIGRCSMLGTNCVVLPGVTIAAYSVVGAKSLVEDDLEESHVLYVGVPARKKRSLDPELGYFTRTKGVML